MLRVAFNDFRLIKNSLRHEDDKLNSFHGVQIIKREPFLVGLSAQRFSYIGFQEIGDILTTTNHRHEVDSLESCDATSRKFDQLSRSGPLACRGDLQLLLFSHHAPLANPEESIEVQHIGCDFALIDEQAAPRGAARAVGDALTRTVRQDELVLLG